MERDAFPLDFGALRQARLRLFTVRLKNHLHGFEEVFPHLVERLALRVRAGQLCDVADVAALFGLLVDGRQVQLGDEVFQFFAHGQTPLRICLAMMRRWISLVPSPMVQSLESRQYFSGG